jgi:hypothetical protein
MRDAGAAPAVAAKVRVGPGVGNNASSAVFHFSYKFNRCKKKQKLFVNGSSGFNGKSFETDELLLCKEKVLSA